MKEEQRAVIVAPEIGSKYLWGCWGLARKLKTAPPGRRFDGRESLLACATEERDAGAEPAASGKLASNLRLLDENILAVA